MFRSATFKLTMWYLAIAMAISLLFSIALYNVTTNELNRGLNSESQSLYNQYPVFHDDPDLDFKPGPYYENSVHRILLRLIGFNLLVLVAAGAASYFLARLTLEPIEAAHEQQKRFTADVSHELRTPLTAIKMESEVALLNNQAGATELRKTLSSNLEEVGKLEALINNLLRLTRLEADELQQNFSSLSSQEIIEASVSKVEKLAKTHSVSIDQTAKTKALVLGSQESLVQLLVILLDNAIKYSPSGSSVNLEASSTGDKVIWRIKDHGQGIEPAALEHIFDRFYRADSSRGKAKVAGYGLGLSIGKMIADLHHGSITINSKVGEGTTATVSLPKVPQ